MAYYLNIAVQYSTVHCIHILACTYVLCTVVRYYYLLHFRLYLCVRSCGLRPYLVVYGYALLYCNTIWTRAKNVLRLSYSTPAMDACPQRRRAAAASSSHHTRILSHLFPSFPTGFRLTYLLIFAVALASFASWQDLARPGQTTRMTERERRKRIMTSLWRGAKKVVCAYDLSTIWS